MSARVRAAGRWSISAPSSDYCSLCPATHEPNSMVARACRFIAMATQPSFTHKDAVRCMKRQVIVNNHAAWKADIPEIKPQRAGELHLIV